MARKPSKRITLRKKHKIEKKVAEHHRKARKELKTKGKKKGHRDPGVPSSMPFKEQILHEVALKKQQLADEEARKKEERHQARLQKKQPTNLEELSRDAAQRDELYESMEAAQAQAAATGSIANEKSRKFYFKEFKKVLIAADVIIQVLDARDPLACRCPNVEAEIIKSGKKLILLLNKIDLVPKENVLAWLQYLRKEFPTLPFKASTQKQRHHLGRNRVKLNKITIQTLESRRGVGVDNLMKMLGNYSRNNDIKTAITIGVIGIPNVGKSSVINSLKRSRACNVGGVPGVTRSMQEVQLDSKLRLLDSPGVVLQTSDDPASLVLRNCVNMEQVVDPQAVVELLITKITPVKLMQMYNLREFSTSRELLALIAYKRGLLKKGGIPNLDRAAKTMIADWNHGSIHYYTNPPKQAISLGAESASLVSSWSAEFDIDALLADESNDLQKMDCAEDAVVIESTGPMQCATEESLEQELVVDVHPVTGKRMKDIVAIPHVVPPTGNALEGNQTVNKLLKSHLKHLKKQKKRTMRTDEALAEATANLMDIDTQEPVDSGDYDFGEHFDMKT